MTYSNSNGAKLSRKAIKYYSLGELCEIKRGVQLNRRFLSKEGKYPVYSLGRYPAGYWHEYNCDENTITMSNSGAYVGYVNWVTEKFWSAGNCIAIHNKDSKILDYRFLYYVLKNMEPYVASLGRGIDIKNLNLQIVHELKIPVPSFETQKQIAKTLDTFAELTAELTARKKQYNYYRDLLINQKLNKEGVEYKTLGELCEIKRGNRVTKSQLLSSGYPVISGGKKPLGYFDKFNRSENTITIAQYGTAGYVAWQNNKFWANDVCYCVYPDKILDNRYLYYVLSSKQESIYAMVRNSIPASIKLVDLEQLKIPVPSLEIQKQIATILDKFSTLCNDITQGLPAEIALNQKRYEYYRNKLLTFEEGDNDE